MGAFVLCDQSVSREDRGGASRYFQGLGFGKPKTFDIGAWSLLLWKKQLVPDENYVVGERGRSVFAVGTPVYRRLGYRKSLERLLVDYDQRKLDLAELSGSFCLIFQTGATIEIVTDPGDLYHIFCAEDGRCLSSSMRALAFNLDRSMEIERDVVLEQLITGFFAGPRTPVKGVMLLDQREQQRCRLPGVSFLNPRVPPEAPQWHGRIDDCVDHQLQVLRAYFRNISSLAGELGAAVGLSGGYDSRLVLALAVEAKLPIRTHSFSSGGHAWELESARSLASVAGAPFSEVPVRLWRDLDCDDGEANLADVLGYYDGRTNKTQGSPNDVHTRRCRVRALDVCGLGLSGHGGELYRNREHLRAGPLSFSAWLRYFVIDPSGWECLNGMRARRDFEDYLWEVYARFLGTRATRKFNRHEARRWYARVWLPFAAGPKLCAENQLSFSLIVFADEAVVREALRCTPVIGVDGVFEAELIRRVSPALAAVDSNYGHSFRRVPRRVRWRSGLVSAVPHGLRLMIGRARARRRFDPKQSGPADRAERDAIDALKDLGLPVSWDTYLADPVNRERAIVLGANVGAIQSGGWGHPQLEGDATND